MSLSPKARFLAEEALARKFLDIVDSEAFTRATELAMVQISGEAKSLDEIKGALRLLEILKSLPEPFKPLPSPRIHNLDHALK